MSQSPIIDLIDSIDYPMLEQLSSSERKRSLVGDTCSEEEGNAAQLPLLDETQSVQFEENAENTGTCSLEDEDASEK